jgi:hypothetical protein
MDGFESKKKLTFGLALSMTAAGVLAFASVARGA